ncbi:MAG: hypothetical protein OHK0057_23410 [Thermoflexibacter sp.]
MIFLTNVLYISKEKQLEDLQEALDIALDDIIANRKMIYTPALSLTEAMFAIHLRFFGDPSEEAKIFGEEQRIAIKKQKETAYL